MDHFAAAVRRWHGGAAVGAKRLLCEAIRIGDRPAECHGALASILAIENRLDAALIHAEAALRCAGDVPTPGMETTLGNILSRLGRHAEARGHLAAACVAPHVSVWQNRGLGDYAEGRYADAVRHLSHALALDPGNTGIQRDRAAALLADGQFKAGFEAFEARWSSLGRSLAWDCGAALWCGEPLAGAGILVHAEQGFGDTIQFARWLPMLVRLGASVDFACPRSLWPLAPVGVRRLVDILEPPSGRYDFHVPLMSLPRLTGIMPGDARLPARYFNPEPRAPVLLVAPGDAKRIGLIWAGSGTYESDRQRSMPLIELLPLIRGSHHEFYSLQVNPRAADLAATGLDTLVTDLAPRIADWGDTAAFVRELDAVVAVDTAVLHLAGALGCRTIGLLAFSRCWRWSAPWYDDLTLVQQTSPGDWKGVVERVCGIL